MRVVHDENDAKLLTDPMRREILKLLAREAMTENDLAETLGLSAPSVGYHLRGLKRRGFIALVRKEPEEHGIIQKFYHTNALVHIIDKENLPLHIRRYFMPVELERARGVAATLSVLNSFRTTPSSQLMEKLANSLSTAISRTATKYPEPSGSSDPEVLVHNIYRESLKQLLRTEFKMLAPLGFS